MHGSNRRDFLRTGGAALAGAALVGVGNAQVDPRGGVAHQKTLQHSEIMRRMFPGAHDKAEYNY